MTIPARNPTITMIVEMTFHNPTTSLFGDHARKQWANGHLNITSRQHLENESQQHDQLRRRRNHYILSIGRSKLSRRRRMNASLRRWQPRTCPIKRLNDWIRPLINRFTRGRIQTKPVSNWLHGKREICGDMSPLLTTWHASSSAQNTTPRQPFLAFQRWSWHVWSL